MLCAKYIFVSSILDGAAGMQWEQTGDRRISVPGYLGNLCLTWTTNGLKIRMDEAVCRVRSGSETVMCDSEIILPWQAGATILLLQEDVDTPFAQVCISQTDDSAVWDEYKNTISDKEARILSDIYEQECYFWRALSSHDDFAVAYERLCALIEEVQDMHSNPCVLDRLKHLQYKYSVRMLNAGGQSEGALDRLACDVRSLIVDERYKL